MKAWIAFVAVVICGVVIRLMPDDDSEQAAQSGGQPPAASTPVPAPAVELTDEEKQRWAKLPADRSAIPALLYHGIGPESDFANADDASYGVEVVDLPPRPLLLTFDDGHHGHRFIPVEGTMAPYYAVQDDGESFAEWQERMRSDIEWGEQTLADHIEGDDLLGWLSDRYDAVFTQDVNARADPGNAQPFGRVPVERDTTTDAIYDMLISGEQ